MIARDAEPTSNRPVLKPIDIRYPGRRSIIMREDVENGIVREPDAAIYHYDPCTGAWSLK